MSLSKKQEVFTKAEVENLVHWTHEISVASPWLYVAITCIFWGVATYVVLAITSTMQYGRPDYFSTVIGLSMILFGGWSYLKFYAIYRWFE